MRDFTAGLFTGGLLLLFLAYIWGNFILGEIEYRRESSPTKNYDCKGTINSRCKVDTVYYDQHPQKKCWYLNYENR